MRYEIFPQGSKENDTLNSLLDSDRGWYFDDNRGSFYKDSNKSLITLVHEVNFLCKIDLAAKTADGDDAYTVYCDDGVFYGNMLKTDRFGPPPIKDNYTTVYYTNYSRRIPYCLTNKEKEALLAKNWEKDTLYTSGDRFSKRFPDSGMALLEFKEIIKRDLSERSYESCETCSIGKVHSFNEEASYNDYLHPINIA